MDTPHHQQWQDSSHIPAPAHERGGWQTRAIAAYQRSEPEAADLRLKLTVALQTLTGRSVAADAIVVNTASGMASVRCDNVLFRWADGQLFVIRPCSHCGLGAFTSPPVRSVAGLGFALGTWQPLHDDCQPFEADAID